MTQFLLNEFNQNLFNTNAACHVSFVKFCLSHQSTLSSKFRIVNFSISRQVVKLSPKLNSTLPKSCKESKREKIGF